MPDTWIATLSDGREFAENSPSLVAERSPWRELERLAAAEGIAISDVTIVMGARQVSLDAGDGSLVCGQSADVQVDIASGRGSAHRYRWICRQGADAWLWRMTDGIGAWEIETTPGTPGRERMPMPPAVDVPPPRPGEGAGGGAA